MSSTSNLWDVRELPDGLSLKMRAGRDPALVLIQGENQAKVELAYIKVLAAVQDGIGPIVRHR